GYRWLCAALNPAVLYEEAGRVESYNVMYADDQRQVVLQSTLWHPSLPYALSALTKDPRGADPTLIGAAVRTILPTQHPDGHWPNPDGSAGIWVWSVWPFLDGLCDFLRQNPVRSADRVSWISNEAVLIWRGSDRALSVWRILGQVARRGVAARP